ncbi:DNA topoisomerase IV subunit A, partial [Streptococcus suis]
IAPTSRAKRGLLVLRELKSKPHRDFKAGSVRADEVALDLFTAENSTSAPQELEILSTTGQVYRVVLSDLSLSERTSNGSFISETI